MQSSPSCTSQPTDRHRSGFAWQPSRGCHCELHPNESSHSMRTRRIYFLGCGRLARADPAALLALLEALGLRRTFDAMPPTRLDVC